MIVNNEREALQLLREQRSASEQTRRDLLTRSVIDQAYFEGAQWVSSRGAYGSAKVGRLLTSYSPDSPKLRVTLNRVTHNVLRVTASTHPDAFNIDVQPSGQRAGPEDWHLADLFEQVLHDASRGARFLAAARTANHRRCICGTYGIGFSLDSRTVERNVDGEDREVPDVRLRAITFPPERLSLDPSVDDQDLLAHDVVIYSDIWTKQQAEKTYGIELEDNELVEIGSLASHEIAMHGLIGGKLYDRYRQDSKRKGVVVHQMHVRTEDGRHGQMFVVVEAGREKRVVNADDPSTPFGGNAMPLALIRGHKRANVHWGLSDVAMLRADQDLLNLHATLYNRVLQAAGRPKWMVDKAALDSRGASAEDVRGTLNNEVGGVIFYNGGSRGERHNPPQMVDTPGPQPHLVEGQRRHEDAMRTQAFRAEGHLGGTKSHVPDASFQRALEEADMPVGIRMGEDLETYGALLHCLLGTEIESVRAGSFSTLRRLARLGIDATGIGRMVQTDADDPPVTIRIRESSVRYRSPLRRRQDLENSVALGATDATEYRLAMASDLDTPVWRSDGAWAEHADRIARSVLLGEEFEGIPAGPIAGSWILQSLRLAMVDPRAEQPETRQRLLRAIAAQQQANFQDQIASNPELAMQAQAAQQPAQAQASETLSLGEVLGGPVA